VIWRLMQWGLLISLIFYIGSTLISLFPFLLFLGAATIAVCCVYALLPENLRLPSLEMWLYPDWQPSIKPAPTRPPPTSELPTSPKSDTPPSTSTLPATPTRREQHSQPPLDFENIPIARGRLPSREQLIAFLKSKVIGQDAAIETLVRYVLSKLASQNDSKPLVILLAGTTGTGKTELCKTVPEAFDTKLHRFDMGEYSDNFKSSNLMGSAIGYVGSEAGGALPNVLRQSKKFCFILFDEVEKANPNLWQQLLAFIDEGRITDTRGTVTAPKNTICLMTSNLAAKEIGENPDAVKSILREDKFFSPEFLGRVNKIIALPRLSKANMARLTVIIAKKVATRYGINLVIEPEVLPMLVQETFEEGEQYGGRGIEEKIKDLLIDNLVDMQAEGITQARLAVIDGNLKAVAFE
jgi:ATP-dependent Clp protease ATP-binding subunit ClpA